MHHVFAIASNIKINFDNNVAVYLHFVNFLMKSSKFLYNLNNYATQFLNDYLNENDNKNDQFYTSR